MSPQVPTSIQSYDTTHSSWQDIKDQATVLVRSGLLPASVRTAEAAVAIIMTGREMGIGPMQSFAGIHVIEGKPSISPQLMLSQIRRSGLLVAMKVEDLDGACRVTLQRRGEEQYSVTYTLDEAKRAGLLTKLNWQRYQANMLRWRAIGYAADVVFPDVVRGYNLPDEMGAITGPDGEVLEGSGFAEVEVVASHTHATGKAPELGQEQHLEIVANPLSGAPASPPASTNREPQAQHRQT